MQHTTEQGLTKQNAVHPDPIRLGFIQPRMYRSTLDENIAWLERDALSIVQDRNEGAMRNDGIVQRDSAMERLFKDRAR